MKINCSPDGKIFCFFYPDSIHVGYENEEIRVVKREDFLKYLFHLCIKKDEGHVLLFGPNEEILQVLYAIQDYEFNVYGETPILYVVLNPIFDKQRPHEILLSPEEGKKYKEKLLKEKGIIK